MIRLIISFILLLSFAFSETGNQMKAPSGVFDFTYEDNLNNNIQSFTPESTIEKVLIQVSKQNTISRRENYVFSCLKDSAGVSYCPAAITAANKFDTYKESTVVERTDTVIDYKDAIEETIGYFDPNRQWWDCFIGEEGYYINICSTTYVIYTCPTGYIYNGTNCSKTISYKFYEYQCNGMNSLNQPWKPINKGLSTCVKSDPNTSNINSELSNPCNSPTPPLNNCVSSNYNCATDGNMLLHELYDYANGTATKGTGNIVDYAQKNNSQINATISGNFNSRLIRGAYQSFSFASSSPLYDAYIDNSVIGDLNAGFTVGGNADSGESGTFIPAATPLGYLSSSSFPNSSRLTRKAGQRWNGNGYTTIYSVGINNGYVDLNAGFTVGGNADSGESGTFVPYETILGYISNVPFPNSSRLTRRASSVWTGNQYEIVYSIGVNNGTLMSGGIESGNTDSAASIIVPYETELGFISNDNKALYTCASGVLVGTMCQIEQCPNGYVLTTGTDRENGECKLNKIYNFYNYSCPSGTNSAGNKYEIQNSGGDCNAVSLDQLIDTNNDGISDSCNTSTPPTNNCVRKDIKTVYEGGLIFIEGQWMCSAFSCNANNKCGYGLCPYGTTPSNNLFQDKAYNPLGAKYNDTCIGEVCDYIKNNKISYCISQECPSGPEYVNKNGICYKQECPKGTYMSGSKCISSSY